VDFAIQFVLMTQIRVFLTIKSHFFTLVEIFNIYVTDFVAGLLAFDILSSEKNWASRRKTEKHFFRQKKIRSMWSVRRRSFVPTDLTVDFCFEKKRRLQRRKKRRFRRRAQTQRQGSRTISASTPVDERKKDFSQKVTFLSSQKV
jgi:hypothetical protein